MSNYLAPNVFVEDKASKPIVSNTVGAAVSCFIGFTPRGVINKPVLVSSWQNFLDNFAYGVDTPFMANSDLAYAVYGFFQNGGKACYIIRVAGPGATATTFKSADTVIAKAVDVGNWSKNLTLKIVSVASATKSIDFEVKNGDTVLESFKGISSDPENIGYFDVVVNGKSKYIEFEQGVDFSTLEQGELTKTEGTDDLDNVTDGTYTGAFPEMNLIAGVGSIAIPDACGSLSLTKALSDFAKERGSLVAIIEADPNAESVTQVVGNASNLANKYAAMYYSRILVTDPLSKVGALRPISAVGHIAGVYSRIITNRGIGKAPAGTEANIVGAVALEKELGLGDIETLNSNNINCIVNKTGYGIVIWGARNLGDDSTMRYVSQVMLNSYIKIEAQTRTLPYVFENHSEELWNNVKSTVKTILDELFQKGILKGSSSDEAYFVKCDSELNSEEVQNSGQLICEVGYADTKPAEFIIIRIAHTMD